MDSVPSYPQPTASVLDRGSVGEATINMSLLYLPTP